ncbi:MAG: MCE family protein [Kiloniellales bacterium]|nr:MCE family protein [Kiloniellales bacterium]
METRANYIMVGTFVLAFSLGLIAFVLWLAKFQHDVEFNRYDIFFQGSVTGLKDGSAVRYNGVKVGEVVFIGLDRDNPSQVRALIEVESNTPVRVDTEASLALEGLTGGRYILLSGGSLESAQLEKEASQKRAVIPSKPSPIDQLMQGVPEALTGVNTLLAQANLLLGEDNRGKVGAILDNFVDLSATVAGKGDNIEALIEDTAGTMENLRDATEALRTMAGALKEDSNRLADRADAALGAIETMAGSIEGTVSTAGSGLTNLIEEMRGTADAFAAMANEFQELAAENRGPIRDFTNSGLYELTTLLTEARGLLIGLNRVTTEVERDPARFLFGDQQQGYETQQ